MDYRTNIKIGSVTNLSDARFAAAIGAHFIGFCFDAKSPCNIGVEQARELLGWTEGPHAVAEFGVTGERNVRNRLEELGNCEYVQLNELDADLASCLHDVCIIQNLEVGRDFTDSQIIGQIDKLQKFVRFFMLSFSDIETQGQFLSSARGKEVMLHFCREYPVLLNFCFTPENIAPLVDTYKPFGINLIAGVEESTGLRDFSDMHELLEKIEKPAEAE